MAKKSKKIEDETKKVVAKCDNPNEVIANCDNLRSLKFYPSLPYAYTEQGIGQLSTVVHSKIAIERSIMIMNAFVAMRRFMVQNAGILMRIAHLEKHQIETDQKMDMLLDRMDKRADNVEATIHSRYYESFQTDLKKHNEQYLEIKFVQLPHRNHDRFLIIDDDV